VEALVRILRQGPELQNLGLRSMARNRCKSLENGVFHNDFAPFGVVGRIGKLCMPVSSD
jgi:hypothetical protein